MHQLMYMSRELAGNGKFDFSDQLYQLLASIMPSVNLETILNCLNEAKKDCDEEKIDLMIKTHGTCLIYY